MVIPTFERSLDLVFDNEFELNEEEIQHLFALLSKDKKLMKKIDMLIESIDPLEKEKEKFKDSIMKAVHSNVDSVENLYNAIIKDEKIISFIQEIFLKRMI